MASGMLDLPGESFLLVPVLIEGERGEFHWGVISAELV